MKASLKIDKSEFAQAAKKLKEARRVAWQKLLHDQGKLFTRDCIQLTPPRGPAAITQSLNEQRKIGEKRITKDIEKVFKPITSLQVLQNPSNPEVAQRLKKLIAKGDLQGIKAFLERLGIKVDVALEPDPARHEHARDQKGRVRRAKPCLIVRVNSLKRYTKRQLGRAGKTKAGFTPAATALGVSVPKWISRHGNSTPGFVIDRSSDPKKPSITIGNLVIYAGSFQELHIIEQAFRNRINSMKAQAEQIMAAEARKAGSGQRRS